MIRAGDVVVVAAAVVLVVLSYQWVYSDTQTGEFAEVYVDGQLRGSYALLEDQQIVIDEQVQGRHVHAGLHIRDGRIHFAHSNCSNQICVQAGSIYRPGRSLICAPNRIAVTVAGEGEIVTH